MRPCTNDGPHPLRGAMTRGARLAEARPGVAAIGDTSGMAEVEDPGTPLAVMVEDSPDARLFIELSSHAADLMEAHHALALALQGHESGSTLADASPFLVGFAVVAYGRCILHSNVRGRLTDHVDVPEHLAEVHAQIKTFRNATIAHSQSELAVTYPVGFLDPSTLEVSHVSAVTMTSTLPMAVTQRFLTLVEAMIDQLDQVIDPIRTRLEAGLKKASPDALLAGAGPTLLTVAAEHFEPRSKRTPYPTRQTLYWDQDADGNQHPPFPGV